MGGSPSGPAVTVLVTELDNALFDWLAMWPAAFGAMLEHLVGESGAARSQSSA
jgi:hypothetical protein